MDAPKKPDVRLIQFGSILSTMEPGRLLDLACGQGVFSTMAKAMGWDVTAVDVRTARMPTYPGIRWVRSDVREFPIHEGEYDCIAILGLLYHLELKDQLALLSRCSHTTTIIDTHFSLAPTHVEDGYRGHTFDELQGRTPDEHRGGNKSSWENPTAFWPDEASMVRMLYDAGYGAVYQLSPSYREDRTFCVAHPERTFSDEVAEAWRLVNMKGPRPRRLARVRRGLQRRVRS